MSNELNFHKKIVWYCRDCNWVGVSDAGCHHCMDVCPCDKSGVDLEDYGCRLLGNPVILATFENGKWTRKRK